MDLGEFEIISSLDPWQYPRNTAAIVTEVMKDRSRPLADRMRAVEIGGGSTVIDDEVARNILGIVEDSSEDTALRARAAIALGPALEEAETNDPEFAVMFDEDSSVSREVIDAVLVSLKNLHSDVSQPKLLRRRSLEAAVRYSQDWQILAIAQAAEQNDVEWRQTAAFAMRYNNGFEKEILNYLKDPDPIVRREAMKAAGEWELKEAWPEIRSVLESPEPQSEEDKALLLAAIEAATVNPEEAEEHLVNLADSEDEDIADAADDALTTASMGAALEEDADSDFDDDEDDLDDEDDDEGDRPGRKKPF